MRPCQLSLGSAGPLKTANWGTPGGVPLGGKSSLELSTFFFFLGRWGFLAPSLSQVILCLVSGGSGLAGLHVGCKSHYIVSDHHHTEAGRAPCLTLLALVLALHITRLGDGSSRRAAYELSTYEDGPAEVPFPSSPYVMISVWCC